VSDRLAVLPQYLLPKRALTVFAGKIANAKAGKLTTHLIEWFVDKYQVDMSEAANPDVASYTSFNEFFTRPLKSGIRPLANSDLICPVDGAISQFGPIAKGQIFRRKDMIIQRRHCLVEIARLPPSFTMAVSRPFI
jgi:phosphatidylserine decarboxylase